jgi:hypothetical protein
MKRSILAVLLCATALMAAAPANADDETYLETLEAIGIAVDDPSSAIAMGKSVCAGLDQGAGVESTADEVSSSGGLSTEEGALVVGVSIAAYCDHHKGLIGR